MLSNPTGGPEQSKRAAQQLSDANSEIPKALAGGAQKVPCCPSFLLFFITHPLPL